MGRNGGNVEQRWRIGQHSTYEPLVGTEWHTRNIASARTLIVYPVYLTNEPCHLEIGRAR